VLNFAKRSIDDRMVFFDETASSRGIRRLIVEKDFWVCFTLRLLFEMPDMADVCVFKGGTSLSKVFNITRRFSEDIDLSVDPGWLGIGRDDLPDTSQSRTQNDKRMKELNSACCESAREKIQPNLERAICEVIGSPTSSKNHLSLSIENDSPVLLFHYPTKESNEQSYIQPRVKLEFGSLTDQEPSGKYAVSSWVAEDFPDEFKETQFSVISLEPERTFWEKATILHAEFHRPPEKQMRLHLSRDIYDLCKMASHESGQNALADFDLLERVVKFNQACFSRTWANYDKAKPGSFCLVLPDSRLPEVKSDYKTMQAEMIFEESLDFDELIRQLKKLEEKINSSVSNG
jgi:predicted nucleotidyltransferase component of viral defense system